STRSPDSPSLITSSACPAPMNTVARSTSPSVSRDADVDRNAVREHIEHRRTGNTLLDDSAQFFGGRIARNLKTDSDPFVAVSNRCRQSEDALEIDVAFNPRLHRGERHPANRGDVADARRNTRGQCMQQEFDRRRSAVESNQDRGMVRAVAELRDVTVFSACAAE